MLAIKATNTSDQMASLMPPKEKNRGNKISNKLLCKACKIALNLELPIANIIEVEIIGALNSRVIDIICNIQPASE